MLYRSYIAILAIITSEQPVASFLLRTMASIDRASPAGDSCVMQASDDGESNQQLRSEIDLLRRSLRLMLKEESETASEQPLPKVHPLRRIANIMGLFLPPAPIEEPYSSAYWEDPRIHSFGNVGSYVSVIDQKYRSPDFLTCLCEN